METSRFYEMELGNYVKKQIMLILNMVDELW